MKRSKLLICNNEKAETDDESLHMRSLARAPGQSMRSLPGEGGEESMAEPEADDVGE